MKKTLLTLGVALLALSSQAQVSWGLDLSHSSINFSVDHMVISETAGKFGKFDVKATSKADNDFDGATVTVNIEAGSINTADEKRDGHLKSADFFEVEKYPTISFVAKSMKKAGSGYKLSGDITMHGVTKPITLDVKYRGTSKDPWGNTKAGFKISGKLNRKDFGLVWNKNLETGGLLVGEEVTIDGNLELAKQK